MNNDWLEHFPGLHKIKSAAWQQACTQAKVVELPPERQLFHTGDSCRRFLLVLEGSVRVQKLSDSGREILLYRVESGQSCILTTACLLGNKPYQAEAFTETSVKAVTIPAAAFQHAMDDSALLREYIFSGYGQRLTELLMLIEAIAFGRLDCRLADYLLQHGPGPLKTTHQQIARELGTAREVVSRTLKEFEHRGWVKLARGSIELQRIDDLKVLSGM